MPRTTYSQSSHWGAYDAIVENGVLVDVLPFAADTNPSPLLGNIVSSAHHSSRISQPHIRAGWLNDGPGPTDRRGADQLVPVSWEDAIPLVAAELRRVYGEHGSSAVFGGSYGWSSAGRFHHAQSQLHRFLNCLGGYVSSVNTYSTAAGEVILDRVAGGMRTLFNRTTTWPVIAKHTELIVAFGGIPLKNTAVSPGGASIHTARDFLKQAADRGVEVVHFGPLRDDVAPFLDAEWNPLRPGTDVAVMLGLAHTLLVENLHDRGFLDRYCAGFERFEPYVLGTQDGVPKSAEWAAAISEIPAETIRNLARRMATRRTFINISWSLQRSDHGEQAPWMGLALAAMLGQIGLPGGGYGFGYGSMSHVGDPAVTHGLPFLPQGKNRQPAFIPVARISDLLLNPCRSYEYDGRTLTYPDIRLVYWSGGNPFHHHQDLGRLREALGKPDTVIVHDPYWTAAARHADIVLPATISLERDDIGAANFDPHLIAMKRALPAFAQSRHDYDIFSALAAELGISDDFTEGLDAPAWLERIYDRWRQAVAELLPDAPSFPAFWERGHVRLPLLPDELVLWDDFRADPDANRLRTATGKIEIFSDTIDAFGYADCPGHPTWIEPAEWLGGASADQFPLQLVANNPSTRLHSQLDAGAHSQASKIQGREPVRINPADAAPRGIESGHVVRLFNARGSCLAGAIVSSDVRPGVVQLSTGAWYDPLDPSDPRSLCVHGNPNVLTLDKGTSSLAQGCSGQHALVEIEAWTAPLPPIRVFDPPTVV